MGSQFDPYNNEILPGCSSTPPGQEMFAAHKNLILQENRVRLELGFQDIKKRPHLYSDDSSEDEITENVISCFHNKISDDKHPQKKKVKITSSEERNMDIEYVSGKKKSTRLHNIKRLPFKKRKMYSYNKSNAEQISVIIPNIQLCQISENKPKVMYFHGNKLVPEKEENTLCFKSNILDVKKIPEEEPMNDHVCDTSLDVEDLVEKAKMLSFHDKVQDEI